MRILEIPKKFESEGWSSNTDLPLFEEARFNVDNPKRKFNIKVASMPPFKFLVLQWPLSGDPSFERWLDFAEGTDTESIMKALNSGQPKVPTVVLEYNKNRTLYDFQEGRHRALAAYKLKRRFIPVYIARRRY